MFFGRDQVITDINHWLAQINENDITWLSLSAPVGAGKSSLVHAGILPLLIPYTFLITNQQNFDCILDFALMPRSQKPHIHLLALLLAKEKLSATLSAENYADILNKHAKNPSDSEQATLFQLQLLPKADRGRFVLFVDHLEQLFDCYSTIKLNADDHASFFLLLQLLVTSKKCLLITATREQYQAKLVRTLPEHLHPFQYKVPAFSHSELIDIIQKPAELAGVGFEYNKKSRERLNSEISQQLQSQSVPINSVQYMLAQLYTKKFNQLITYKAYEETGGIAGSLAAIAEQTYQQLTEQEQISFKLILFRIITLKANGQVVTSEQPCAINHFADQNKLSVINKFINAGIFQLALLNGQNCIYLAHNSLLTTWLRIHQWTKTNISKLYSHHDLQIAAQRWLYHDKSSHLLIHSNKKIKHINDIIRCNDFNITTDEKELIALSLNKLTHKNRIKKTIIAAFFISFVSLVGLSVSLVEKNQQVSTTRDNAENLISFILYDLKDKLAPLGKLELLNIVADKTLDYFTLAGTEHLTGKSLEQWVEALHILGEVNINKNNFTEAEAYFKQTLVALNHALKQNEASDKNYKSEENEKLLEHTMLANYWLGYSAFIQLDYQTAKPFLIQYLTYANTLSLHYPKSKWQLEQSYALNNLGALAEKTSQLSAASDYFERSAQIKLALLEIQPNNLAIRTDLADTRSWQSNIQAKSGKLNVAIDSLKQALKQIEKIGVINNNFKLIERMANLEHKIALLYYDMGDLTKAESSANKAKVKITTLIDNDNNNNHIKNDLLWSHLLSIQILINQQKLDQALVLIGTTKDLISQLKSTAVITTDVMRANVHLLHYQACTMALLSQPQSALVAIIEANKLFKKHLSIETEATFYARIVLTQLDILNNVKNVDKALIQNELTALITLLETQLQSTEPNYKALAAYLVTAKFIQQLQPDKYFQLNSQWLQLYQQSDYNIPNYSMTSSMDSNEEY